MRHSTVGSGAAFPIWNAGIATTFQAVTVRRTCGSEPVAGRLAVCDCAGSGGCGPCRTTPSDRGHTIHGPREDAEVGVQVGCADRLPARPHLERCGQRVTDCKHGDGRRDRQHDYSKRTLEYGIHVGPLPKGYHLKMIPASSSAVEILGGTAVSATLTGAGIALTDVSKP